MEMQARKNAYETEVSAAKGIISATDIHLNGEILNIGTAQKVKLKCYSCREPRHNYAEFLINGTSTDGISYNKTIDKCSNQYGECNLHVCSCHRSGNEFINIFNVTNVFGTYYSCEMRFNDNDKKSIFSIERTVYVNNTVVDNVAGKKLTKPANKGNNKNRQPEDTGNQESKNKMADVLNHGKIEETIITVAEQQSFETEANISQKNRECQNNLITITTNNQKCLKRMKAV
ncbi:unnamed protein product [Mytilus edulis]|uniref:Uncharacterized protein n=1 Tax=Mytilus edulis TaxID=6550 RepID=A0A8S3UI19_MYTED|nr:unnamed protein product [Mytilus edulis]